MRNPFILACLALLFSFVPCVSSAQAQSLEAFNMEEKGGGLPSLDEYKDVPKGLLLSPEQAEEVAKESGEDPAELGLRARRKLNYDKIMELYKQGKFTEVVKDLQPLAEGGHHGAEELMGIMYKEGQGVKKDTLKGFDLLSRAAEENRPLAQHHIAIMYYLGEGVTKDLVMALAWLHIALVHYPDGAEKDRAKQDRDRLYEQLTRRDKDRALEIARGWLSKRGESHLLDLR